MMEIAETDDGFRAVFDRTFPLAERIARRITGDANLAQDLAAEALTRLFTIWGRMAGKGHVDAWVSRVATNLAIGVVRKGIPDAPARHRRVLEDDVVLRLALADALDRLPTRQRQVVVLRYLSDLSESQVADLLGVSAGSVKTHLHRGLNTLRSVLHATDDSDVEVRLARD